MQNKIVSIRKTARNAAPSLPYEAIAKKILGNDYDLSLVICGDTLAQKINTQYRKKAYKPNVLSFPYSRKSGEIFLNVAKARREATEFNVPFRDRLAFLFIHACWHLVGLDHGVTMERREKEILRSFGYDSDVA